MYLRIIACLAAALVAGGCSLVQSSQSISDSVSRSSDWSSSSSDSSSSSSPDGDTAAWREDVRSYAATFVREGGELDAFRRGLSELAEQRGISDWQQDVALRRAVREGLAAAGLDSESVARLESELYGTT